MILEIMTAVCVLSAGVSGYCARASKRFAENSREHSHSSTAAAATAAKHVTVSGHKNCDTCGSVVARYEVDAAGKTVCANCKGKS